MPTRNRILQAEIYPMLSNTAGFWFPHLRILLNKQ
jgi:hypothetical protein